jgi:hypothetical protein
MPINFTQGSFERSCEMPLRLELGMSGKRQPKGRRLKVVYARVKADVYAELCTIMEAENLKSFGLVIERLLETIKTFHMEQ